MKHLWSALSLLYICFPSVSCAQPRVSDHYRPYVGAAVDAYLGSEKGFIGWGFEGGVLCDYAYVGVEAGRCPLRGPTQIIPDDFNAELDLHNAYEVFYACHLGFMFASKIGVGVSIVESFQSYPAYLDRAAESSFNIGPDVHLGLGENSMITSAFTVRRGFKFGLDYVF